MANVPQSDSKPTEKESLKSVAQSAQKPATPASSKAGQAGEPAASVFDFNSPELYLNRELTWLAFNKRVLSMADDPETPLLERVKYLAIISKNIDEFHMKRIGGLKQQQAAGIRQPAIDGSTPAEQITACHETFM